VSDHVLDMPADLQLWVEAIAERRVTASRPIGSGTSRRIWAVDLESGDGLVVRFDTGDGPVAGTRLDLRREADVYSALAGTSVALPRLRALHPDGTALLVDRVDGVESLNGMPEDRLRSIGQDFGRRLGQLHSLDPGSLQLGSATVGSDVDPTLADIDLWRVIDADRSGPGSSPAVGVALEWLASTVPPATRPSVCHGDAGPGNFLHDGEHVTALLDWEFAHVGDAHDDLAWVVVRNQMFGRPLDLPVTFAGWSEASGSGVDPGRVEWFRALVLARMLISCDSAIAWAGREAPSAQAQAMLQPYLALAVFEGLRRAGCSDLGGDGLEEEARTNWEVAPIAGLLGDPVQLDDLGGLL
jgi:aminoglycoside phosphotransferase (APT) family kinase protein